MSENKQELKYIKIGLTPEEYETLAKLSKLQNRPMSTLLIEFMREANVFGVLGKVVSASEKIISFKNIFKRKTAEVSASIT